VAPEARVEGLVCKFVRQIRIKGKEGKVLYVADRYRARIYTSQTPVNYEKGDPRMSKQNVNARADQANNEHSKCSRKKEHHDGKREKVERETAHEENTG